MGECIIRVCSYNLLSQALCNPDHFFKQNPEDCDPEIRYNRIKLKLLTEIRGAKQKKSSWKSRPIFALQELSETWASRLIVFFAEQDYHLISSSYGSKFSDYMGIGIAFPREKYKLVNLSIKCIADYPKWPSQPEYDGFSALVKIWSRKIWKNIRYTLSQNESDLEDAYEQAAKRKNRAIWVKLEDTEKKRQFCLGNYHMPCMFWAPDVMLIHTTVSFNYFQRLSKNKPLIIAGDFNFKPDSACYELIKKGQIDKMNKEYPKPPDYDPKYDIMERYPVKKMNSAYATHEGKEPDFTNYSWVKPFNPSMKDEPFIGTLDYLFYTPTKLRAMQTRDLPSTGATGPLPTKEEPSDHLLISGTFSL